MRSWRTVFVLLVALVLTGAAQSHSTRAQTGAPEPIARVAAGDFRALAVSPDGRWLMVADAASDQLRVYDLSEANQPLVAQPSLDGTPLDVVAGIAAGTGRNPDTAFAVVAVDLGDGTGEAPVIAPPSYDPSQSFTALTWITTPDRPRSLVLSMDGHWVMVIGTGGWTLVELTTLDENTQTFYATPLNDAIIVGDRAIVAARNDPELYTYSLSAGAQAQANRAASIALDAQAEHLALNQSGTMGAAALSGGNVLLFDAETLEALASFSVGSLKDMRFLSFESGEWLVTLSNDGTVHFYDVTDPSNPSDLGPLDTSQPIQAITTYNDLIFAADQNTIGIWQAGTGGLVGSS